MSYKILNFKKINFEEIIRLSTIFNLIKIESNNYESILELYDGEKIVGMVNYCLIPSLKGKTRLLIRNIYLLDENNFDNIIKSLCAYCKKKNLSIKTTLEHDKYNSKFIKILHDNNFKGENVLYYIN